MTTSFIRRLWSAFVPSAPTSSVPVAAPNPPIEVEQPTNRLAVAGATVVGLVVASGLALGALVTLAMALAVIYFLLTDVLGIRLELDPRSLWNRAQQYASSQRN
jgi:hypothetical protein